jgi:long-chain fatty acid transport protein
MAKRTAAVIVAALLVTASPALASGFGFYEQGAKASGQGGAWVARADDASANWYNPAALVYGPQHEIQFGLNYLESGSDTQFSPSPGVSFDAVSNTLTPVHFYYSQMLGSKVAWGVGFNSPFGLVSEWKDAPLTSSSRRAELRTYLFNPNIAFKLGEMWSLALGADYLAAEVREFSRDATLGPLSTTANLTGEGSAWGFNGAIQLKTKWFLLAGQYRSSLKPTIVGDVRFSGPAGTLLNSSAQAKLKLPGQVLLGAAWTSKRFDVEGGAYYTQWKYFDQIHIDTDNPLTDTLLSQSWTTSWAYRLGFAARFGSSLGHEFRAGLVRDHTPIPTEFLRPSIPDADRNEASLGYGYLAKSWGLDAYAMYVKFDDVTATGSPTQGVIPGTYSSTIWLAGVTAKYRF